MKLREWLYQQRISIKDFAGLIGYDRAYVQTWLSGIRKPSKRVLYEIRSFTMGKVKKFSDLLDED